MNEKKTKPKSDGAEIARRVDEVLRIRLDGAQYHDVLQYASKQGWDVSPRQVSTYIRRADDLLLERMERNRKRLVARRLAQREALFARAVSGGDFRTALVILSDMDKLQGHYLGDRDLRELIKLASAQEKRIRELEQRLVDTAKFGGCDPPTRPASGPANQHVAGDGQRTSESVGVHVGDNARISHELASRLDMPLSGPIDPG